MIRNKLKQIAKALNPYLVLFMSQFMMTSFSISAFKIVMNCATYTIKVFFLLFTFVQNISIIKGRTDLQNDALLSIIDQIEESLEKIDLQNSTKTLIDTPSESLTQIQKSDFQSKVSQLEFEIFKLFQNTSKVDCHFAQWIGDGQCDDDNNNPECDFDGGDCCSDTEQIHCTECLCKTNGSSSVEEDLPNTCISHEWIGDGVCDDENNVPECDYDGGDCCVDTEQKHCKVCECIVT